MSSGEMSQRGSASRPLVRSVAFYLPQFHPIPENDAWWGPGFTEWSNVRAATPRFPGHYQPHVPSELGYYDLRDPDVRRRQAELAAEHGVYGFCYYHYWFGGRRVLERPITEVLRTGEPDLPFCVAWANENWTRTWDGRSREILLQQAYSREDDLAHIRHLRELLTDPRYITQDGRPVLLVYRASLLPNPRATTDLWRDEAANWGLPGLYLAKIESFPEDIGDPTPLGFDAAVDFQPKWRSSRWRLKRALDKAAVRLGRTYTTCSYDDVLSTALRRRDPGYQRWPCVTPMWDNSPRRPTDAFVVNDSTPAKFEDWLRREVRRVRARTRGAQAPLLFVNAWNEWGEGCHLEPCERWGRGYLEAHARAVLQPPRAEHDATAESVTDVS